MASNCCFPDIICWIQNLPPISQWKSKSFSLFICSSSTSSQSPSLNLSVARADALQSSAPTVFFSITAEFSLRVALWTSKPYRTDPGSSTLLGQETFPSLFINFVEDVLQYGGNSCRHGNSYLRMPKPDPADSNFKEIFNLAFLTLTLLVCIYEAPMDLRSSCLNSLKNHLANCRSRNATKVLMKLLGSNMEEQWMRSIHLAITNWILELQKSSHTLKTPSPLFSYSISTFGLWKVHLYCPVIAMDTVNSTHSQPDERLLFSLNYHQLEGVIQFNYKVLKQQNWFDVVVNTDNVRCDIVRLITEALMEEKGEGASEKHFPSRISLQLTPLNQTNILSVSVGRSSENMAREFEFEKGIEAGFDPPNPYMGIKVSAGETTTVSLKPWKFEESVNGYSANFNWFLHDSMDGREVFSSRPSRFAMLNPKSWFRDRYSSAYRPFTRQGGVIFAGDEYGDGVKWKVDKGAIGRTMEWEIRGWIWLTYWPNKHSTLYSETRRLEFREVLHITVT